jgi:hypothetical protein
MPYRRNHSEFSRDRRGREKGALRSNDLELWKRRFRKVRGMHDFDVYPSNKLKLRNAHQKLNGRCIVGPLLRY